MNMVRNPRINLAEIDISEVSDMSYLFQKCYREDYSGIESWDVSHVTNMEGMFQRAETFNADISQWDVSSVEDMCEMFEYATSFNQPLGSWDVSKVGNMRYMFAHTSFNQPLDSWDIRKADDDNGLDYMFNSCPQNPRPKWYAGIGNLQYIAIDSSLER